jgi:integrase/recombinase XerD
MTTDAVTALLAAPDSGTRLGLRDQFFMILMYDLAARDAEMLALTLADIDTRRLTADLPGKGSKPRRLPITSQTARYSGRYTAVFHPSPEPEAPLLYTVRNNHRARMSDDNVAMFIRQHAATARTRCPDVPARSTLICCATHRPCISARPACPWPCSPSGSGTLTLKPRSSTPTPTLR